MLLPNWGWKLLWKHYQSQKARPAIRWMNRLAIVGLALGSASWMSVSSIMEGLQNERRNLVLAEKPHLIWEGSPRSQGHMDEAALKKKFHDKLKDLRLIFQTEALLEVSSENRGKAIGSGVILQGVSGLGDKAMLGAELAASLELAPGDEVRLRSVWKLELEPLYVVSAGVFESGLYDVDLRYVRMDRTKLQKWLSLPDDTFTRLEVILKNPYEASALKKSFESELGLSLKTWQETDASLWYSLKLEKIFMNLAMFFVILLAGLAVHLALSVRVADKTREIALLMALGAKARDLTLLYLIEGAFLGVLGAVMGLGLSWVLCALFSGYFKMPEFYYSSHIPIDWKWSRSLLMAFVTVIVATLASWLPAKRVTQTEIQEALRS